MATSKPAGHSDRTARLVTVRDTLSTAIAECESKRDLAALSREYRAVLAELDALQPARPEKGSHGVDEIGKRRAAKRRADAEDQDCTGSDG